MPTPVGNRITAPMGVIRIFAWLAVLCGAAQAQQVSSLPSANLPLSGGEWVYVVQGGVSKKTPASSIQASQKLNQYTVATLPACNSSTLGLLVYVTNASVAPFSLTYNATVTSANPGGPLPVFCNGTAWVSH